MMHEMVFERCVILNGSKTWHEQKSELFEFERCVILNGSKTEFLMEKFAHMFERCVILNGSKTDAVDPLGRLCLRDV